MGLCGTDLHILAGEHGVLPVVPGHEVTGTVVAAGAEAGEVRVGDRVAVDPSLPCHASGSAGGDGRTCAYARPRWA